MSSKAKKTATSAARPAATAASTATPSSTTAATAAAASVVSVPPPAAAGAGAAAFPLPAPTTAVPQDRKLIIVLEQASLETVKTKKGFELLNCDDHVGLHKKSGRNPALSRPDITHQLLLALLDSPLNKAGLLQVYIETVNNVLVEVSPHTRIPRTFKRFAGLMVQLLHKMKVRAADSSETLLKVIKNPVTQYLPVGACILGLEAGARLVDPLDIPKLTPAGKPVVFVIGAMSHGDIKSDFIEKTYGISRYPLSAACAVGKLLNAYEHAWGVL